MADKKISQLASGTNAQAGDLFVIARSGANYSLTTAQLFNAPSATATLAALTVDTNTLFVDAVNNRVSVGTTALSASNSYGTPRLGVASDSLGTFHVETHNDNASEYSFLGLMRSRGTRTAPTHVQSGDPIGTITAQAYNDAGSFPYRGSAAIQFLATANHTVGSLPTAMTFSTTPSGTNSPFERMRLDAAGNLGLGVTPSAASATTMQFPNGVTVSNAGTAASFAHNAVFNSGWKYVGTGAATLYQKYLGAHAWFNAPSGTAGNAISFTQAMTLSAAGNLTIGGTNDSARLRVEGTTNLTAGIQLFRSGNICGAIWTEASALRFGVDGSTGFTERWQINNSGHLLAFADNSYDIGASGATRPRDLFLGGNMVGGGWVRAGAASAGAASTTTIGSTTTTAVGATGAASALPANPLGYIIAHVGTTEVRIPYYNA